MAHKVQVGGHLLVTTTHDGNLVLDPEDVGRFFLGFLRRPT